MKRTSHARRILAVLILAVLLGFLVQRLLRPEQFGRLGHYRAPSLAEIMDVELIHQGKAVCAECHSGINQTHEKDIHFGVQCEDCHGPGNLHVKYHHRNDRSVAKDEARMPREYTLEGCLFCHRKLSARPRTFAQIDPLQHYESLYVVDRKTRCIECHSPHEPLFLLQEVSRARVHPVILECEHCHEAPPEKDHTEVADHPVIFVCRDCHAAVASDFETHEHAFLRCTACHLFHRENETSGRIFKIGNRLFCLLCHEEKPFKDKDRLPQISYPEHITEMATVMRRNPEHLVQEPTACLTCHFDHIHDRRLIERLREQLR